MVDSTSVSTCVGRLRMLARSLNGGVRVIPCLSLAVRDVQTVDNCRLPGIRDARGAGVRSPPLVPTSDGLRTLLQQHAGALATTPEERRAQRRNVDHGQISSGGRRCPPPSDLFLPTWRCVVEGL